MAKRKRINKLMPKVEKFALGDFVTGNAENSANYQAQIDAIPEIKSVKGSAALSGLGAGATVGSVAGPIGTAVGAVVGGIGGLIFGNAADQRAEKRRIKAIGDLNEARSNITQDLYNSSISTTNDNPYGIYQEGGDVKPSRKNNRRRNLKSIKAAKSEAWDKMNPRNADGDRRFENVLEFFDPSGITSWDDVYRTLYDGQEGTTPTEFMGALPLVGKLGKLGKGAKNLKPAAKMLLNTPIAGRIIDGVSDAVNLTTTYDMGGDILDPTINIEKGELQIDPESGKILREYSGINPETGGLYEPHSKKGDDTMNNMVTAKDGTFIITKAKAGDYKKSIENNDQLQRNAILQNIRNEKRRRQSLVPERFAVGGDIIPLATSGVTPNLNFNIPTNLNPKADLNIGTSNFSNTGTPINYGNIANDLIGFGSGIYNIVQGSRSPNYQNYRPVRLDIENRRQILDNMPREVSANPALNNIRRSRRQAYNTINQGTSNPTIARANALALENTFLDAENNALYNNEILNNQIRGQRSSILSNLSNQDMNRTAMNVNNMNQVDEINRALSLAKEQQVNTGVSQIIENQRNRQFISDQKRNDRFRLQLLRDMSPYIGNYMDNWEQYLDR